MAFALFLSVATLHADSKRRSGWFDAIVKVGKSPSLLENRSDLRIPSRPYCLPTTCENEGKNCGSITDGCGGRLECGNCSGVDTCGGGGRANVCGQVCYDFAYTAANYSGVEAVFENNNCTDTPVNKTRSLPLGSHYSRLSVSPNLGDLSFATSRTGPDGRYQEYMTLMDRSGTWRVLDGTDFPSTFTAIETALSSFGSLAIVSMEPDGRFTLRLNENDPYYPRSESHIVLDTPSLIPFEITWIPRNDWISSRRLIIATAGIPLRDPSRLYVVQLSDDGRSARAVPLEDGVTPGAMAGYNPAPSRRGSRLLFVNESAGRQKIFECAVDLSELDASPNSGRAYCRTPMEIALIPGNNNDYASPCWSYDNRWIFYATHGTDARATWDIYRSSFGSSSPAEPLVVTSDAEEREVTCGPLILEAAPPAPATVMPYREPLEAYPSQPQTYELLQPCTSDAQCTTGRICREGYCHVP